jgi:hypothetical protein
MPSIGKDLATIRNHLGLTIQDIQSATKLPLDTLKKIESGEIFESKDEIITYVRSFVRTYARALKLKEDIVNRALDQEEIGNYNHLLLSPFPELRKEDPSEKKAAEPGKKAPESGTQPESAIEKPKTSSRFVADFPDEEPATTTAGVETAGETAEPEEKSETPIAPPPDVRSVNWADMGRKFSPDRPRVPVWLIAAGVILVVIIGTAWFLSRSGIFASDDPDMTDAAPQAENAQPGAQGNGLQLNLTPEPPADPELATLDETLYITVYAATGNLDPVRVWSDLKPRIDPYWMEQGVALNFEFRDTLRIRGQYQRMLIFLNGHLIENPRQEHYNPEQDMVELTRDLFEAEPRWATTVPFELPPNVQEPDSVALRPSF